MFLRGIEIIIGKGENEKWDEKIYVTEKLKNFFF